MAPIGLGIDGYDRDNGGPDSASIGLRAAGAGLGFWPGDRPGTKRSTACPDRIPDAAPGLWATRPAVRAAVPGSFGLALAGTILGSLALLTAVLAIVWQSFGFGLAGYGDLPEDDLPGWMEEPTPNLGSLGDAGADGFTAAEVSAAVNDAVQDGYGKPFECPAIPAAMAGDLQGRVIACTGEGIGWIVTGLVVFSDADGSFSVTVY